MTALARYVLAPFIFLHARSTGRAYFGIIVQPLGQQRLVLITVRAEL